MPKFCVAPIAMSILVMSLGLVVLVPSSVSAATVEAEEVDGRLNPIESDALVQYFLQRNYLGAFKFVKYLAEKEHPGGQMALGLMYAGPKFWSNTRLDNFLEVLLGRKPKRGKFDEFIKEAEWAKVPVDETKAYSWVEKAAEAGYLQARSVLASFHMAGIGVKKDLGKAAEQLQKSATLGHRGSQQILGFLLATLQSKPSNRIDAYKWIYLGFICNGEDNGRARHMKKKYLDDMPEKIQEQGKQQAITFARTRGEPCREID